MDNHARASRRRHPEDKCKLLKADYLAKKGAPKTHRAIVFETTTALLDRQYCAQSTMGPTPPNLSQRTRIPYTDDTNSKCYSTKPGTREVLCGKASLQLQNQTAVDTNPEAQIDPAQKNKQRHIPEIDHVDRRKAFLSRRYRARTTLCVNGYYGGEPFLRHFARTYMSDLHVKAIRRHLEDDVMTRADYAEMMIWYRRARNEPQRMAHNKRKKMDIQ